jgi:hypothetical protein
MTKEEIHKALHKLEEHCIPEVIDSSYRILIRNGMNQVFLFMVEQAAKDPNFINESQELIKYWNEQWDIDLDQTTTL